MTVRVLLLGGTGEARELADRLAGDPDVRVVSSLAGRVRTPLLPAGDVRVGGFGGVDGLADWLAGARIDAVLDATHPFAAAITANALAATRRHDVPYAVLRRPGWRPGPGDDWRWVDTVADANPLLRAGQRVFLATGRGDIDAFADRDDLWFLLRTVDPPEGPLPRHHEIVLARGPYAADAEVDLLRAHRVDVLVTRDSGGDATAAKLTAARLLGLPVLIARRPPLPGVTTLDSVADALRWLAHLR